MGDVCKLRTELDRVGTTHITVGGAIHIHLWSAIMRRTKRYEWRSGGPDTGAQSVRSCVRGHVLLLQCAQTGDFLQATVGRVIEIRAERNASEDMMQAAESIDSAHEHLGAAYTSQHRAISSLSVANLKVTDIQAPGLRQVISTVAQVGDPATHSEP